MKRTIAILYAAVLCCLSAMSQSDAVQIYDKALQEYELGRFDTACIMLTPHVKSLEKSQRISAYRILALSHINMDEMEKAEVYARELLNEDPYYTAYDDSPRFADIIDRIKGGKKATITTASKMAETLDEVPVPVTLITAEMIENSGARNLQEVLCTYVPSMTNIASNSEMNIAMRGLFSASQEVVLVMVNGHRLNSYSTNASRPDFSISLDKVKQIEVLRGPASSLYGGVALAGVVNIITKTGTDQDGATLRLNAGNYGQKQGSVIFGKHLVNFDIMAWASIYNATGEKKFVPASVQECYSILPKDGNYYIGGFNQRPSHDYGFTVKYGDFSFMMNNMFSKTVAQYNISSSPYDYEGYEKLEGSRPGNFVRTMSIDASYEHRFNEHFSLKGTLSYDKAENHNYEVAADDFGKLGAVGVVLPLVTGGEIEAKDSTYQMSSWHDETIGASLQASYTYDVNSHHGEIIAGTQYSETEVLSSEFFEGCLRNFVFNVYPEHMKGVLTGNENSFNGYLQYKHSINKRFVLNAGIRYDNKQRLNERRISEWSPRMALVYMDKSWSAKLSYSKSFVDASYLCRLSSFDTKHGDPALTSEYQYSWQLSLAKHWSEDLFTELTGFYNRTTNIVIQYGFDYANAGEFENMGAELASTYTKGKWMANLTASYQRVLSSSKYSAEGHIVYNVPGFSANMVLTYRPISNLRLSTHVSLLDKQKSYNLLINMDKTYNMTFFDIPFHALWNMNASYTFHLNNSRELTLKADVHNIIGKNYQQGGGSAVALYQQGRWFTFGASVNL